MKFLAFTLNLPWIVLGFLVGLVSLPEGVRWNGSLYAIILNVKSFWWYSWIPKMNGVRAMAIGHVVLLGPNILENDLEHELIHVEQAIRTPLVHPILYIIESIRKGHRQNKYEVEAYERAGNLYVAK